MCGLKLDIAGKEQSRHRVTPFVGVWIETTVIKSMMHTAIVTPFVGVWIETCRSYLDIRGKAVTPFVGVWIETKIALILKRYQPSHTLRGCVD